MADTSQMEQLSPSEPQTNGIPDGIDEDEKMKMRPADIDADMREMERRKRVEMIMNSRLFREELERIIETQLKDGSGPAGLLQQISDMMGYQGGRLQSGNVFRSSNCVVPINDIRGVESMGYAKGEKILRCKLAAVYRLMDLYGWTQGIYNHITARLNQDQEHFLVNPFGMLYHEITASSLVKIDMQGGIVEPGTTNFGVNVAGFMLHSAIHAARPDIKCIIHVHTPSVLAVSSLKCGLLPLCQEAIVIGEVGHHPYLGGLFEPEEREKIARNLGPVNKVMFLANHGAVCCGETIEEAFYNVYNTVLACETQIKLMPMGVENLILVSDENRKQLYEAARRAPDSAPKQESSDLPPTGIKKEKPWRIGGIEFEALMRMLDNAGFRTGYIYRHPLVKGELPRPRNDVEVPPAVSSLGYLLEEEEMYKHGQWKKYLDGRKTHDRTRWLNSPNVYQKVEILETGTPDPKKITKWVADGSPTHTSTPVKIDAALQFVPKNTDPREFKKLQQQIKDNRRADKITSGPQSHILEGVSWEEAKKLQDANISATGDQVILVGAASKGIIQRGFQHNAMVYKTPYAKNPFDTITDEEIEEYKKTVERKQRGESFDEDQTESEPLSSSLQNSRPTNDDSGGVIKSPLLSPTSAASETEEESRDEPRVLRIETKQVPRPSQAEVVLSDAESDFPDPSVERSMSLRYPEKVADATDVSDQFKRSWSLGPEKVKSKDSCQQIVDEFSEEKTSENPLQVPKVVRYLISRYNDSIPQKDSLVSASNKRKVTVVQDNKVVTNKISDVLLKLQAKIFNINSPSSPIIKHGDVDLHSNSVRGRHYIDIEEKVNVNQHESNIFTVAESSSNTNTVEDRSFEMVVLNSLESYGVAMQDGVSMGELSNVSSAEEAVPSDCSGTRFSAEETELRKCFDILSADDHVSCEIEKSLNYKAELKEKEDYTVFSKHIIPEKSDVNAVNVNTMYVASEMDGKIEGSIDNLGAIENRERICEELLGEHHHVNKPYHRKLCSEFEHDKGIIKDVESGTQQLYTEIKETPQNIASGIFPDTNILGGDLVMGYNTSNCFPDITVISSEEDKTSKHFALDSWKSECSERNSSRECYFSDHEKQSEDQSVCTKEVGTECSKVTKLINSKLCDFENRFCSKSCQCIPQERQLLSNSLTGNYEGADDLVTGRSHGQVSVEDNYVETRVVQNVIPEDNYIETKVVEDLISENNYIESKIVKDLKSEDNYVESKILKDVISEDNYKETTIAEIVMVEDNCTENKAVEDVTTEENCLETKVLEDVIPEQNWFVEDLMAQENCVETKVVDDVIVEYNSVAAEIVEDVIPGDDCVETKVVEDVIVEYNSIAAEIVEHVKTEHCNVETKVIEVIQETISLENEVVKVLLPEDNGVETKVVKDAVTKYSYVETMAVENVLVEDNYVETKVKDVLAEDNYIETKAVEGVMVEESSLETKAVEDVILEESYSETKLVEDGIAENICVDTNVVEDTVPEDCRIETNVIPEESYLETRAIEDLIPQESCLESKFIEDIIPEESYSETKAIEGAVPEESYSETKAIEDGIPEESYLETKAIEDGIPEESYLGTRATEDVIPEESYLETRAIEDGIPEESYLGTRVIEDVMPEESYLETKVVEDVIPEESYSETKAIEDVIPEESYSETKAIDVIPEESYSETKAIEDAIPEESYLGTKAIEDAIPEENYSETKAVELAIPEESYLETKAIANISEESYLETIADISEESYLETKAIADISEESYLETKAIADISEESYLETKAIADISEESYSETKAIDDVIPEESYLAIRATEDVIPEESYLETRVIEDVMPEESYLGTKAVELAIPEESYLETKAIANISEESYLETKAIADISEESYLETKAIADISEESYSETKAIDGVIPEESYLGIRATGDVIQEESYLETRVIEDVMPEESYLETKAVEDVISEESYLGTKAIEDVIPEESYSETKAIEDVIPEESYSETKAIDDVIPEESYSETKAIDDVIPEESYSETKAIEDAIPEESYLGTKAIEDISEENYSETKAIEDVTSEESYLGTKAVELAIPEESYLETKAIANISEESYLETIADISEESYSETKAIDDVIPEESYLGIRATEDVIPEESYLETRVIEDVMPEESYLETKAVEDVIPEESYLGTKAIEDVIPEESYSETKGIEGAVPEESYLETKAIEDGIPEESYLETKAIENGIPEESYLGTRATEDVIPEESYLETRAIEDGILEESYLGPRVIEDVMPEESYLETKAVQDVIPEESYLGTKAIEDVIPEESSETKAIEDVIPEESYSETKAIDDVIPEESYSETKAIEDAIPEESYLGTKAIEDVSEENYSETKAIDDVIPEESYSETKAIEDVTSEESYLGTKAVELAIPEGRYLETKAIANISEESYLETIADISEESYLETKDIADISEESYLETKAIAYISEESYSETKAIEDVIPEGSYLGIRATEDVIPEESYLETRVIEDVMPEESYLETKAVEDVIPEESYLGTKAIEDVMPEESYLEIKAVEDVIPEESALETKVVADGIAENNCIDVNIFEDVLAKDNSTETMVVEDTIAKERYLETKAIEDEIQEESFLETKAVEDEIPEESFLETKAVEDEIPDESFLETKAIEHVIPEGNYLEAKVEDGIAENNCIYRNVVDVVAEEKCVETMVVEDLMTVDCSVETKIIEDVAEDNSVETKVVEDVIAEDKYVETNIDEVMADDDVETEVVGNVMTKNCNIEINVVKDAIAENKCMDISVAKDVVTEDNYVETMVDEDVMTEDCNVETTIVEDIMTEDCNVEAKIVEVVMTEDCDVHTKVIEDVMTNNYSLETKVVEGVVAEGGSLETNILMAEDEVETKVVGNVMTKNCNVEAKVVEDVVTKNCSVQTKVVKYVMAEDNYAETKTVEDLMAEDSCVVMEVVEDVMTKDCDVETKVVEYLMSEDNSVETNVVEGVMAEDNCVGRKVVGDVMAEENCQDTMVFDMKEENCVETKVVKGVIPQDCCMETEIFGDTTEENCVETKVLEDVIPEVCVETKVLEDVIPEVYCVETEVFEDILTEENCTETSVVEDVMPEDYCIETDIVEDVMTEDNYLETKVVKDVMSKEECIEAKVVEDVTPEDYIEPMAFEDEMAEDDYLETNVIEDAMTGESCKEAIFHENKILNDCERSLVNFGDMKVSECVTSVGFRNGILLENLNGASCEVMLSVDKTAGGPVELEIEYCKDIKCPGRPIGIVFENMELGSRNHKEINVMEANGSEERKSIKSMREEDILPELFRALEPFECSQENSGVSENVNDNAGKMELVGSQIMDESNPFKIPGYTLTENTEIKGDLPKDGVDSLQDRELFNIPEILEKWNFVRNQEHKFSAVETSVSFVEDDADGVGSGSPTGSSGEDYSFTSSIFEMETDDQEFSVNSLVDELGAAEMNSSTHIIAESGNEGWHLKLNAGDNSTTNELSMLVNPLEEYSETSLESYSSSITTLSRTSMSPYLKICFSSSGSASSSSPEETCGDIMGDTDWNDSLRKVERSYLNHQEMNYDPGEQLNQLEANNFGEYHWDVGDIFNFVVSSLEHEDRTKEPEVEKKMDCEGKAEGIFADLRSPDSAMASDVQRNLSDHASYVDCSCEDCSKFQACCCEASNQNFQLESTRLHDEKAHEQGTIDHPKPREFCDPNHSQIFGHCSNQDQNSDNKHSIQESRLSQQEDAHKEHINISDQVFQWNHSSNLSSPEFKSTCDHFFCLEPQQKQTADDVLCEFLLVRDEGFCCFELNSKLCKVQSEQIIKDSSYSGSNQNYIITAFDLPKVLCTSKFLPKSNADIVIMCVNFFISHIFKPRNVVYSLLDYSNEQKLLYNQTEDSSKFKFDVVKACEILRNIYHSYRIIELLISIRILDKICSTDHSKIHEQEENWVKLLVYHKEFSSCPPQFKEDKQIVSNTDHDDVSKQSPLYKPKKSVRSIQDYRGLHPLECSLTCHDSETKHCLKNNGTFSELTIDLKESQHVSKMFLKTTTSNSVLETKSKKLLFDAILLKGLEVNFATFDCWKDFIGTVVHLEPRHLIGAAVRMAPYQNFGTYVDTSECKWSNIELTDGSRVIFNFDLKQDMQGNNSNTSITKNLERVKNGLESLQVHGSLKSNIESTHCDSIKFNEDLQTCIDTNSEHDLDGCSSGIGSEQDNDLDSGTASEHDHEISSAETESEQNSVGDNQALEDDPELCLGDWEQNLCVFGDGGLEQDLGVSISDSGSEEDCIYEIEERAKQKCGGTCNSRFEQNLGMREIRLHSKQNSYGNGRISSQQDYGVGGWRSHQEYVAQSEPDFVVVDTELEDDEWTDITDSLSEQEHDNFASTEGNYGSDRLEENSSIDNCNVNSELDHEAEQNAKLNDGCLLPEQYFVEESWEDISGIKPEKVDSGGATAHLKPEQLSFRYLETNQNHNIDANSDSWENVSNSESEEYDMADSNKVCKLEVTQSRPEQGELERSLQNLVVDNSWERISNVGKEDMGADGKQHLTGVGHSKCKLGQGMRNYSKPKRNLKLGNEIWEDRGNLESKQEVRLSINNTVHQQPYVIGAVHSGPDEDPECSLGIKVCDKSWEDISDLDFKADDDFIESKQNSQEEGLKPTVQVIENIIEHMEDCGNIIDPESDQDLVDVELLSEEELEADISDSGSEHCCTEATSRCVEAKKIRKEPSSGLGRKSLETIYGQSQTYDSILNVCEGSNVGNPLLVTKSIIESSYPENDHHFYSSGSMPALGGKGINADSKRGSENSTYFVECECCARHHIDDKLRITEKSLKTKAARSEFRIARLSISCSKCLHKACANKMESAIDHCSGEAKYRKACKAGNICTFSDCSAHRQESWNSGLKKDITIIPEARHFFEGFESTTESETDHESVIVGCKVITCRGNQANQLCRILDIRNNCRNCKFVCELQDEGNLETKPDTGIGSNAKPFSLNKSIDGMQLVEEQGKYVCSDTEEVSQEKYNTSNSGYKWSNSVLCDSTLKIQHRDLNMTMVDCKEDNVCEAKQKMKFINSSRTSVNTRDTSKQYFDDFYSLHSKQTDQYRTCECNHSQDLHDSIGISKLRDAERNQEDEILDEPKENFHECCFQNKPYNKECCSTESKSELLDNCTTFYFDHVQNFHCSDGVDTFYIGSDHALALLTTETMSPLKDSFSHSGLPRILDLDESFVCDFSNLVDSLEYSPLVHPHSSSIKDFPAICKDINEKCENTVNGDDLDAPHSTFSQSSKEGSPTKDLSTEESPKKDKKKKKGLRTPSFLKKKKEKKKMAEA